MEQTENNSFMLDVSGLLRGETRKIEIDNSIDADVDEINFL